MVNRSFSYRSATKEVEPKRVPRERAAELPRYGNGKVPDWVSKRHGPVDELMHTVHLGWREQVYAGWGDYRLTTGGSRIAVFRLKAALAASAKPPENGPDSGADEMTGAC
jgi:hypothetical protein